MLTLTQAIPLGAILLLAVELRLLFRTGMVHLDSLVYAHLARNLSDGTWRTFEGLERWATTRIGLYGPVAAGYALFGTHDVTTFAWPFVTSLFGIIGVYGICRKLAGEVAGLVAAFLWAILPTGVAAATALLGDGPAAGLSIGAVCFLLVAESAAGLKRVLALLATVACLLLGILAKPATLLVLVFLVGYLLWRRPTHRLMWIGLAMAIVAGLAAYAYYGLNTYYDWGTRDERGWDAVVMRLRLVYWAVQRSWPGLGDATVSALKSAAAGATDWWSTVVFGNIEYSWIAPLWVVATAVCLARRWQPSYLPLLWFWSMFLYLQFGSRSLVSYQPITTASMGPAMTRHFLLLAAPAMMASAIYLARTLRPETGRRVVLAAAIGTGAIALVGMRHATTLSWSVTGESIADLPFSSVSAIAAAVVLLGSLSSPLLAMGQERAWRVVAMTLFLLAIGAASLNPSYRAANEYRGARTLTFPAAVRFLDQGPPLPIVVQNAEFGEQLDYVSGFRLGFNSSLRTPRPSARIRIAPDDPAPIGDAYVLVDDDYVRTGNWGRAPRYFSEPPPWWAEVERFGDRRGHQLRVYRVSTNMRSQDLEAALTDARIHETPATLRRVLDVATMAKQSCAAARAWERLRELGDPAVRDLVPITIFTECYRSSPDVAGPNLLVNGDFARGVDGWTLVSSHDVDVTTVRDPETGENVAQMTARSADQRAVILQGVRLAPETVYAFEATFKSTAPLVALYWDSDVGRFESRGTYPAWTTRRYVFVTPRWDGKPRPANFMPFLFEDVGRVWIKDVSLVRLRFDRP